MGVRGSALLLPRSKMRGSVQAKIIGGVLFLLFVSACASNPLHSPQSPASLPMQKGKFRQVGIASWYGPGFHGRKTASGEKFNKHAMTCAHRTLPFGTRLEVTNLLNGKKILVTVNDRGPYIRSKIIDLSYGAAKEIGMLRGGSAKVELQEITFVEDFAIAKESASPPSPEDPFLDVTLEKKEDPPKEAKSIEGVIEELEKK